MKSKLAANVFVVLNLLLFVTSKGLAQSTDTQKQDYMKMLTDRSAKIINTLGLTDSVKYKELVNIVANQYASVNEIQDGFKVTVKDIKAAHSNKEEADSLINIESGKKSNRLLEQHKKYITLLSAKLPGDQVDKIKDGMTYNVLHVTYGAYEDEILTLTKEQKEKIYNWLVEARELAMDEGSSEDKHKMFGKYKGRINNYLSAEGYDMKKEEKDWQERLRKKRGSTN
jgi:hypothetical protein